MKTENEVIDKSDWRIADEDYDTTFARLISRNSKKLETFRKHTLKKYNETKDFAVFLEDLKILTKAEKMMSVKKVAKTKRLNVDEVLLKEVDPSFSSLRMVANDLGIDFMACSVK
jgi:DNA-binding phage protein